MQNKLGILPSINDFKAGSVNSALKDSLPSFDDEKNQYENFEDDSLSDVPTPPQELKEKFPHHRLYDIEDEYLSENTEENTALDEVSLKDKHVYVNLKDYNNLIVTVKQSRNNFRMFSERFSRIENISLTMDLKMSDSHKLLEFMQRKLIGLDNRLFERVEDE